MKIITFSNVQKIIINCEHLLFQVSYIYNFINYLNTIRIKLAKMWVELREPFYERRLGEEFLSLYKEVEAK